MGTQYEPDGYDNMDNVGPDDEPRVGSVGRNFRKNRDMEFDAGGMDIDTQGMVRHTNGESQAKPDVRPDYRKLIDELRNKKKPGKGENIGAISFAKGKEAASRLDKATKDTEGVVPVNPSPILRQYTGKDYEPDGKDNMVSSDDRTRKGTNTEGNKKLAGGASDLDNTASAAVRAYAKLNQQAKQLMGNPAYSAALKLDPAAGKQLKEAIGMLKNPPKDTQAGKISLAKARAAFLRFQSVMDKVSK